MPDWRHVTYELSYTESDSELCCFEPADLESSMYGSHAETKRVDCGSQKDPLGIPCLR
jgi:hypothetical protein